MRTYLFSLALLLVWGAGQAQQTVLDTLPFAPPGATWVYSTGFPGLIYAIRFHYEKDTQMLGHTVKQISWSDASASASFTPDTVYIPAGFYSFPVAWNFRRYDYLYESGDTVYMLQGGQFRPIYFFGLTDYADTWTIPANLDHFNCYIDEDSLWRMQDDTAFVIDTSHVIFSNNVATWEIVEQNLAPLERWHYGAGIYRNIGGRGGLYPESGPYHMEFYPPFTPRFFPCHPRYAEAASGLACYSDSLRGIMDFTLSPELSCNGLITSTEQIISLSKDQALEEYKVYPNPGQGHLQIVSNLPGQSEPLGLRVYNALGQLLYEQKQYNLGESLRLPEQSPGLYFILLDKGNGQSQSLQYIWK